MWESTNARSPLWAALVGFSLTQPDARRWALLLLGVALLKRGLTGRCDLYRKLHIDSRHPQPKSAS